MSVPEASGVVEVGVGIGFALLLAGMVLAFVRILRGPSLPDRVVGLDIMTTLMVAFTAMFAIASGESAFLDVGIALALVAFLGTVALARYAQRRSRNEESQPEEGP
jgi:multicomponent Na+:H+ antiporter subunit F